MLFEPILSMISKIHWVIHCLSKYMSMTMIYLINECPDQFEYGSWNALYGVLDYIYNQSQMSSEACVVARDDRWVEGTISCAVSGIEVVTDHDDAFHTCICLPLSHYALITSASHIFSSISLNSLYISYNLYISCGPGPVLFFR